jgi:hypothetical protein
MSMRALACGLVFLGVCVFAWGLRYKLSLYDPPHAVSHHMPAAKLLPGREGPELPPLHLSRLANPAAPAALIALTLAWFAIAHAGIFADRQWTAAWRAPVRRAPAQSSSAANFTRPPPHAR